MPRDVEITIRAATAADVPAATRIIADALLEFGLIFAPEGRDADVKEFGSRPDHDDLVAVDGEGTPVGVASLGPQGEPGVGWVSKLFVDKAVRGLGVGRALLDATHAAAARRGYRRVGLRTRLVFLQAITLYERNGYFPEGTARDGAAESQRALDVGDRIYWKSL